MKRSLLILLAIFLSVSTFANLKMPSATINGNLSDYTYLYVTPTGGITSSSGVYGNAYGVFGGSTKTIVPSDAISGYLMKHGFNVVTSVIPEKANKTLIVSYGYTGRRFIYHKSYASGIIIQMRDAATQELVASFEAEGCGADESDNIQLAINSALALFRYNAKPKVTIHIDNVYRRNVILSIRNLTPKTIQSITLKLTYYDEGRTVYEQTKVIISAIQSGYVLNGVRIKRDKPAQNSNYAVKAEIIDYN
ncbi:MAG: hypothetical protein K6A36_05025 [Paludibacteraceae bacterium]|nr:hypothetical protein [Paludibacteraceae bacterium]